MRKISKKLFYYLIFIFWSYIYSQDYLITISGKKYEGQYIRFKDGKVQFIQKGAKHPTDIPSSSVKTVKLANGKTFSFDSKLILNDGTELNGSWIMTSKNFIRFLVTGEKIYTDYDRELVKSITYPDGISMDLDTITDAMFLVTKTKHKDILILGKVDDATAKDNDKKEDKFWTTRKVGNELWIYGKYFGVDFNKGEIQFRGNDGKMYSNPTNVVKIKYDGNTSIDSKTLGILRERSKEILRELLIERCDENKKIKIMVLPFVNDYFGLTKDVIDEMSNACYTIINNQDGLKYLHDNKMKKDCNILSQIKTKYFTVSISTEIKYCTTCVKYSL